MPSQADSSSGGLVFTAPRLVPSHTIQCDQDCGDQRCVRPRGEKHAITDFCAPDISCRSIAHICSILQVWAVRFSRKPPDVGFSNTRGDTVRSQVRPVMPGAPLRPSTTSPERSFYRRGRAGVRSGSVQIVNVGAGLPLEAYFFEDANLKMQTTALRRTSLSRVSLRAFLTVRMERSVSYQPPSPVVGIGGQGDFYGAVNPSEDVGSHLTPVASNRSGSVSESASFTNTDWRATDRRGASYPAIFVQLAAPLLRDPLRRVGKLGLKAAPT